MKYQKITTTPELYETMEYCSYIAICQLELCVVSHKDFEGLRLENFEEVLDMINHFRQGVHHDQVRASDQQPEQAGEGNILTCSICRKPFSFLTWL